jgi:mannose-6-phosphate isomerase-like protein (cupin superfamily)
MTVPFTTTTLSDAVTVAAPDGSVVRILAGLPEASMAHFTLAAGEISIAVRHRTVSELWYVVSGRGQMWRRSSNADTAVTGTAEEVVELAPGVSLSIPVGVAFQFRATGDEELAAVGVTIPSWPGDDEAEAHDGPWTPSVEAGPGLV